MGYCTRIAATAISMSVLAACDGGEPPSTAPPTAASASPEPSAATPSVDLAAITTRSLDSEVTARVADGVMPPTNRWYSGLVFGEDRHTAFASPLSITTTSTGFTMGLPQVTVMPDLISGSAPPDVTVTIDGATALPTATDAGPAHVTLSYGDSEQSLVDVTTAAGWPAVALTATADATLGLGPTFAPAEAGELWVAQVGPTRYGLVIDGGSFAPGRLTLPEGASAQLFAIPEGTDPGELAAALGSPVTGIEASGSVEGAAATTSLTYTGPESTVIALPAERARGLDCDLGEYATVDGPLAACRAASVSWDVPAIEPVLGYQLDHIATTQREEILGALEAEADATPSFPTDTYFGAKALHRQALLVQIAAELGEAELADTLAAPLIDELEVWTQADGCAGRESRCLLYDDVGRGVIGLEPSFGSEQYNDHHFHYGYFLAAAAVAVEHDPSVADTIGPAIDLLAADIASPAVSDAFPAVRVFDPYAGHSWASGYSPFGDGNNQESSSEAVLAWNGVAAWADARADQELSATARWLLAAEADAALTQWVRPDLDAFPEYEHDIVALQWGGKREFATWFTDERSAMLGIQVIPMAPAQAYLAPESEAATQTLLDSVDAAAPDGWEVPFGDYLLMYYALAGSDQAAEAWDSAVALPEATIDGGNSRAAMLAWIASVAP